MKTTDRSKTYSKDSKARESIASKHAAKKVHPGKKGSQVDLEYFREARLFLAPNRATVTFYLENEVASIHYDLLRDEIFYKGHNVKNMTMTERHWVALQNFSHYLAQTPKAEKILKAYDNCLRQLIPPSI